MTLRGQALHKMHSGALSSHKFELKLSDVAAFFLKTSKFLYSGEPLQATPSLTGRCNFLSFQSRKYKIQGSVFGAFLGLEATAR